MIICRRDAGFGVYSVFVGSEPASIATLVETKFLRIG